MINDDEIYHVGNVNVGIHIEGNQQSQIAIPISFLEHSSLNKEEFVDGAMIGDDVSYHVSSGSSSVHFVNNQQQQNSHHQHPDLIKGDFVNVPMINNDNNYHVGAVNQQQQTVTHLSYHASPAVSKEESVGAPLATVAGKKRKSETGLANVSMKTVMRWRGKEGIDIDCLLGATTASTVEERTRAEEILNATGQLLCILCAQSVSGNKKSVRRHQLKNAKHLMRLTEVSNGLPFPTTDAAMNIVVPLPYVPLDLAVSTAFRGCQEAWDIVKNSEKANDFAGLTANLESLGEV